MSRDATAARPPFRLIELHLRVESGNLNNITDKDYYLASYRSGAFAYIGDRRNVRLTLSYEF
ncbi:TonB-dependent receptor [Parahaliea sp. F7430]|uniref:TonB-dependent receptor n=1 Tax=Sediminihaliea albiluteola TaxID=2758564 RepID=A0A7W2TTU2_9GAMM|nr:TonB-dependent receptor [Sediminihaliea albiluteola]